MNQNKILLLAFIATAGALSFCFLNLLFGYAVLIILFILLNILLRLIDKEFYEFFIFRGWFYFMSIGCCFILFNISIKTLPYKNIKYVAFNQKENSGYNWLHYSKDTTLCANTESLVICPAYVNFMSNISNEQMELHIISKEDNEISKGFGNLNNSYNNVVIFKDKAFILDDTLYVDKYVGQSN